MHNDHGGDGWGTQERDLLGTGPCGNGHSTRSSTRLKAHRGDRPAGLCNQSSTGAMLQCASIHRNATPPNSIQLHRPPNSTQLHSPPNSTPHHRPHTSLASARTRPPYPPPTAVQFYTSTAIQVNKTRTGHSSCACTVSLVAGGETILRTHAHINPAGVVCRRRFAGHTHAVPLPSRDDM